MGSSDFHKAIQAMSCIYHQQHHHRHGKEWGVFAPVHNMEGQNGWGLHRVQLLNIFWAPNKKAIMKIMVQQGGYIANQALDVYRLK